MRIYLLLPLIFSNIGNSQINNDYGKSMFFDALEFIEKEKYDSAKILLKNVLDQNPNDIEAMYALGSVYNSTSKYDSAIFQYKKYNKLKPNNPNALTNIGRAYYNKKEKKTGSRYIVNALKMDTLNYWSLFNYAYYELEDNKQKILYYKKALLAFSLRGDFNNNSELTTLANIYGNLGFRQYHLKLFEESAFNLIQATIYNPNEEEIWNNLGNSFQQLKLYNEAHYAYDKALELNPNKIFSLNGKANTYLKMRKINEACDYWYNAIKNGYVFKEEWRESYFIDDPKELIIKHCKKQ